MKLQSKWMTWQPTEKTEKVEVPEVPQVGFGTSGTQVSVHMQISRSVSNPLDVLNEWTMTRCVFRDKQWGGIKSLHRDYCRWAATHDSTPSLEDEFIEWLIGAGMIVDSFGMVYGLVLEEDGGRVH